MPKEFEADRQGCPAKQGNWLVHIEERDLCKLSRRIITLAVMSATAPQTSFSSVTLDTTPSRSLIRPPTLCALVSGMSKHNHLFKTPQWKLTMPVGSPGVPQLFGKQPPR